MEGKNMENKGFLDFAIGLAQEAGQVIMDFREKQHLERIYTSRTHFRTVVDEAVDKLLFDRIGQCFPDHGIYSEEAGGSLFSRPLTWVNDPVDGTINLWGGITDQFGVCISLCKDRTPIVGVINAPLRKELFSAEIGKGTFLNGSPINVADTVEISKVLMGIDSGKFNRDAHLPFFKRVMAKDGITCPFCTACASVCLALVASSGLDAYLATSLNPEDMAAAVCIIREAGGKVTNLKGKEWQLGESSILAANPVLHRKLCDFFGIK
jgi:myo-inositol-1(or 4)-monophosphatase